MIKGLYIAASAMVTNINRQSMLSHNLANINTPGFKQVLLNTEEWVQTNVISPPSGISNFRSLGNMGLGVTTSDEIIDHKHGGLKQTGISYDLAINGNGYFAFEDQNGEIKYTRDGRLNRDSEGNLVTIDGHFILDENGDRINLPEGPVLISRFGEILVEDTSVAYIGVHAFENPESQLLRDTPNSFSALEDPDAEFVGEVQQGFLELANVDIAQISTQMVSVTRAYEAAQRLVQIQDELIGKSISSLGRF